MIFVTVGHKVNAAFLIFLVISVLAWFFVFLIAVIMLFNAEDGTPLSDASVKSATIMLSL